MSNVTARGAILVALVGVGAAAFLYNKQLNLEAEKQRIAVEEKLHERAAKCAEDGKRFAADYMLAERSAVVAGEQFMWDDPEFHYSTRLGTCLVRTRSIQLGHITYHHNKITDLSTNKAVLESYVSLQEDRASTHGDLVEKVFDVLNGPNVSRQEFVNKAEVLMKQ